MRTLLSLFILGLSFSAGSAHAYLSPGEVFPDLIVQNAEASQVPVIQAPAALYNSPEENAAQAATSSMPSTAIYLVAAVALIGGAATIFVLKKKSKVIDPTAISPGNSD